MMCFLVQWFRKCLNWVPTLSDFRNFTHESRFLDSLTTGSDNVACACILALMWVAAGIRSLLGTFAIRLCLLTGLLLTLSGAIGPLPHLSEAVHKIHTNKKMIFTDPPLPPNSSMIYVSSSRLIPQVSWGSQGHTPEAAISRLQLWLFSKPPLEEHWVEPQKRTRTMWQWFRII